MQRVTLETIVHAIFGAEGPRERDELRDALAELMDRVTASFSMFTAPWLKYLGLGLSPLSALHRAKATGRADPRAHRGAPRAARRRGPPRDDVLSMLLEARDEEGRPMSDAELRDELMTLLVAGHETTATALSWAFDFILGPTRAAASAPPPRRDAAAAPTRRRSPGSRTSTPCIKEVLRLRPVIPAVGRKPHRAAGAPAGTRPRGHARRAAAYLTHRPRVLPRARGFLPERFLGKKPDPYAWLPSAAAPGAASGWRSRSTR